MKRLIKTGLAALLYCCLSVQAIAATTAPKAPARVELKIGNGVTDVKLDRSSLRIIKATVGTGTASDFDTYTVYLLPTRDGQPWMQVTTPSAKGMGYNFRTFQSGDANTQALAFYKRGDHLFAVQASKIGAPADAAGSRKTQFEFETFSFNGNDDIPMFDSEEKLRSTGKYVDATEALQREFFGR
jgi:hypothetical protein